MDAQARADADLPVGVGEDPHLDDEHQDGEDEEQEEKDQTERAIDHGRQKGSPKARVKLGPSPEKPTSARNVAPRSRPIRRPIP